MEDADLLALDARDGAVWVGAGKGARKDDSRIFLRLDVTGRVVGSLPSPGRSRALAVALDGSVWILGRKRVRHYTAAGSLLADIDLKPLVEGAPKMLQADSIGAWLWASAGQEARPDRRPDADSFGLVDRPAEAAASHGAGWNSGHRLAPLRGSARCDRSGRFGRRQHRPQRIGHPRALCHRVRPRHARGAGRPPGRARRGSPRRDLAPSSSRVRSASRPSAYRRSSWRP